MKRSKTPAGKTRAGRNRDLIKSIPLFSPPADSAGLLPVRGFALQASIVVLFAMLLYGNTLGNDYALDDDVVISQNRYVLQGASGTGDILTHDAYASFYESMGVTHQLSGGRYRPLSICTFALETSLFAQAYVPRQPPQAATPEQQRLHFEREQREGEAFEKAENLRIAPVRHGFQVVYYVLSLIVLLYFLRRHVFTSNTDIAFVATLLFAAHPLHTEVVANLKSRDEIFSFLFIVLSLIFFFRYDLSRRFGDLAGSSCCLFLALLSKEYAVAAPALAVIGAVIFHKRSLRESVLRTAPLLAMLGLYGIIRLATVGLAGSAGPPELQDVLNDPYLYATAVERIASKINRLDDYIGLLVFPYPLSSDYSYRHFAYSGMGDPGVWLSAVTYGGLLWAFWLSWKKRHPLCFALAVYFAFLALVGNLFFDIGATMGERLIYHSSLGFCMIAAWYLIRGAQLVNNRKKGVGAAACCALLAGVLVLYGAATITRNGDWKNDFTLFTRDVRYAPESALTNGNAGSQFIDLGLTFKGKDDTKMRENVAIAIGYLTKAVSIHPRFVNGYLNLGYCYYNMADYEMAAENWEEAAQYFKRHPLLKRYAQLLMEKGMERGRKQDFAGAAEMFGLAARIAPDDPAVWESRGGANFMAARFTESKQSLAKALALNPSNEPARQGLQSAEGFELLRQKTQAEPENYAAWLELARAYMNQPVFYPLAGQALEKAATLKPGDAAVYKALLELQEKKKQQAQAAQQKPQ